MIFSSLQPFVPSGSNFKTSKELFIALGFTVTWDAGDYIGFNKDNSSFILQNFDNKAFAENFMISIAVDDAAAFYKFVIEKNLPKKFGISISQPTKQPYGLEVNIIDIAGVCWHFVQA